MVIETTGFADPALIVQTLTAGPVLRLVFAFGKVVALVQAVARAAMLETRIEAAKPAFPAGNRVRGAMAERLRFIGIRVVRDRQAQDPWTEPEDDYRGEGNGAE